MFRSLFIPKLLTFIFNDIISLRVLKRKNMNEFKLKRILKNQKDLSKSKKISLLLDTNNKRAVVKMNLLSFLEEIKRT